jgi:hypothetical protein
MAPKASFVCDGATQFHFAQAQGEANELDAILVAVEDDAAAQLQVAQEPQEMVGGESRDEFVFLHDDPSWPTWSHSSIVSPPV